MADLNNKSEVWLPSIFCLQCHVICYALNGRLSMEGQTLSSFCPPCLIAINPLLTLELSTIYGYFRGITHFTKSCEPSPRDLDLLNQQDQHSKHGLTPQFTSQVVSVTFGNPGMVLSTTWNQLPWYNEHGHRHNSIMVSGSGQVAEGWPILSVCSFLVSEMSSVYLQLIDFVSQCDHQLVCPSHLHDSHYTNHIS